SILFASLMACASAAGEPLLSQGIGASKCGDLVADIKPAEGLFNQINLMLYAWVQGYVSAANVALLEYDGKHIDMTDLDASRALPIPLVYRRQNPEKGPANALDAFIKTAKKGKAQWKSGTVEWDE